MFSKTADPTAAPRPNSNTKSVLAQDLKIVGEISSNGTIEVLGEIEGNLSSRGLIVGAEGRVAGSVTADTVEVKGKLNGRVASDTFTLRAAARVAADITYTTLVIESGAQIEGKFTLARD
ncbi:MAG: bactofilin family protein [Paracoccaceae bacterium]